MLIGLQIVESYSGMRGIQVPEPSAVQHLPSVSLRNLACYRIKISTHIRIMRGTYQDS